MSKIAVYRVGVNDVGTAVDGKYPGMKIIEKTFGMDVNDFTPIDCFAENLIHDNRYRYKNDAIYFTKYSIQEGVLKFRKDGKKIIAEYTDKDLGFSYSREEDSDLRRSQHYSEFTNLKHVVTFDVIKENFPGIPGEDRDAIINL